MIQTGLSLRTSAPSAVGFEKRCIEEHVIHEVSHSDKSS
jgi:hypothetical protein